MRELLFCLCCFVFVSPSSLPSSLLSLLFVPSSSFGVLLLLLLFLYIFLIRTRPQQSLTHQHKRLISLCCGPLARPPPFPLAAPRAIVGRRVDGGNRVFDCTGIKFFLSGIKEFSSQSRRGYLSRSATRLLSRVRHYVGAKIFSLFSDSPWVFSRVLPKRRVSAVRLFDNLVDIALRLLCPSCHRDVGKLS